MLTNKKKKQINRLCNKLTRLTSGYVKLEKEKAELEKERGTIKSERKRIDFDKWNAQFWSRYGVISTEVKHVISALRKHSRLLDPKQVGKVNKIIYNAVKA